MPARKYPSLRNKNMGWVWEGARVSPLSYCRIFFFYPTAVFVEGSYFLGNSSAKNVTLKFRAGIKKGCRWQWLQVALFLLTGVWGVEVILLLRTNFNTFGNHLAVGLTHIAFLALVQKMISVLGQPFPGRITWIQSTRIRLIKVEVTLEHLHFKFV